MVASPTEYVSRYLVQPIRRAVPKGRGASIDAGGANREEDTYLEKSAAARCCRVVRRQLMILRRAILHARVRTTALGRLALRHRIVGAFLARSGFQAEVVMDVVGRRLRKGTPTRNRTCGEDRCYHDGTHRILHCTPPGYPNSRATRTFLVIVYPAICPDLFEQLSQSAIINFAFFRSYAGR